MELGFGYAKYGAGYHGWSQVCIGIGDGANHEYIKGYRTLKGAKAAAYRAEKRFGNLTGKPLRTAVEKWYLR